MFQDAPLREIWRNNGATIVLITKKVPVIGVASLIREPLNLIGLEATESLIEGELAQGDKKLIPSQNTLAWTLTGEAEVWHINYQMSHMQTSYRTCFGTSETQQGFCSVG